MPFSSAIGRKYQDRAPASSRASRRVARYEARVDLHGHAALVTGASAGLGRHFAQTLAAQGAAVALAARRRDRLDAVAAEIDGAGGRAVVVPMDVTDETSIARGLDDAAAALGPIDIVVNNAGVGPTKPSLELTPADWDVVIDTDLRGAWLVAQTAARAL